MRFIDVGVEKITQTTNFLYLEGSDDRAPIGLTVTVELTLSCHEAWLHDTLRALWERWGGWLERAEMRDMRTGIQHFEFLCMSTRALESFRAFMEFCGNQLPVDWTHEELEELLMYYALTG